MTDNTPNSLIKIDTPVTARYGKKQIGIFIVSGTIVVGLFGVISNHPHDTPLVIGCLISMFSIIGLVYMCARSGTALYETELECSFKAKNLVKKNEIYKFNSKNTIEKGMAWTRLEGVDTEGRLKFKKTKVYENNYCNYGTCWLVTPSDSNDPESYYTGMEQLYKSIPFNCIHKTIAAQSKHLVNLSLTYEKKLQNKNLPLTVRNGLSAKKKFFDNVKNRVGWMHVIFLGIEYHTNDGEAFSRIDEVRDLYGSSLDIHGVKVKTVTDPTDYAIICAQMSHMENLEDLA
jgi:hypothetical protein